jgi:hypothetical protein
MLGPVPSDAKCPSRTTQGRETVAGKSDAGALQKELGGVALPDLAALSAADQDQLVALIQSARRAQKTQLAAAMESALSHIPMLLRGAVRKILVP